MSKISDPFERIEAYLENALSPEDRAELEAQIQSDPAFAEEVQLQKEARALLDLHIQSEYKAKLQALDAGAGSPGKTIPFFSTMAFRVAASLLILFAFAAILFQMSSSSPSPESYFNTYYEAYPDRVVVRSGDSNARDSLLALAMNRYNAPDYAAARDRLLALLEADPSDQDARFYLGESYLGLQDMDEAVQAFRGLPADSKYSEIANWHKALAYLKKAKTEEARPILTKIANEPGNAFADQARLILSELYE